MDLVHHLSRESKLLKQFSRRSNIGVQTIVDVRELIQQAIAIIRHLKGLSDGHVRHGQGKANTMLLKPLPHPARHGTSNMQIQNVPNRVSRRRPPPERGRLGRSFHREP
eukprot:4495077-Alexandrium_andersonii.AAC.1